MNFGEVWEALSGRTDASSLEQLTDEVLEAEIGPGALNAMWALVRQSRLQSGSSAHVRSVARRIYPECSRAERRLLVSITRETVMGFRVAPLVFSLLLLLGLMAVFGAGMPFSVRVVTLVVLFAGVNFGLNLFLDSGIEARLRKLSSD